MIYIVSPIFNRKSARNTFRFFCGPNLTTGLAGCRNWFVYDFTIIFLPLIVKFTPLVLSISNISETGTFLDMRPL